MYNNEILDSGFDDNKDKHCDLDGWFVDKYGNHRPVIRRINRNDFKYLFEPTFDYLSSNDYFTAVGSLGGIPLTTLYEYSLNDENIMLSSPNINLYLRNNYLPSFAMLKRIRELDHLIDCYTIKKPFNVYRGIDLDESKPFAKKIMSLNIGDVYSDKGYMSTTHNRNVAVKYAKKNSGNTLLFMDIELYKGFNGVPLFKNNNTAGNGDEYEILLPRQQNFSVVNKIITKDGLKKIIYLKMRII